MKTVFKVIGYQTIEPVTGNFINSCVFWIYAMTEDEAIEKAKTYQVKKQLYQVTEVIEKNET